jgi:hypothetical protein
MLFYAPFAGLALTFAHLASTAALACSELRAFDFPVADPPWAPD